MSHNWWKIGFFITLFAFEIAREFAVIASGPSAFPNVAASVYDSGNHVYATGSWSRTDGGDRLMPSVVTIECDREAGTCEETSVLIWNDSVMAPVRHTFAASFSDDTVNYRNANQVCARYTIVIDRQSERVISTRELVEGFSESICTAAEQRIESTLVDGFDTRPDPLEEHFVPLLWLIARLF